jgi:hypothetical protein
MGADKNSSRRMNSAYALNSQPRIPARVCQGHVVTTDLPMDLPLYFSFTMITMPQVKIIGDAFGLSE